MFLKVNLLQDHWPSLFVCFSAFFALGYGDCGEPPKLDFAILGEEYIGINTFPVNATVTYSCSPGYIRVLGTKNSTVCLANSTWSTPEIVCQRKSCGPPGEIENGEMHAEDFLFGSRVNYTCNPGYNMVSQKNYRVCEADGMWSNSMPQCEAQLCPPPNSIPDGNYEPFKDEYQYQESVVYRCKDKPFALIGDQILSCTASGNWSFDAPECRAVECQRPNVLHSKMLSGFSAPYYYEHAVTFECNSGYKMNGSSSVKCNANSQWDPPLPTCYREAVTTVPITSRETTLTKGETSTTAPNATKEITLSTDKQDDSTHGSAPVIAGKFIMILTMFIMERVLSNLF